MNAKRCRRDRAHPAHSWGVDDENACPGVPGAPAPAYVADTVEKLMFRVALLRDLTPSLSEKDKRALDAAYRNLDGVKKRQEGAA